MMYAHTTSNNLYILLCFHAHAHIIYTETKTVHQMYLGTCVGRAVIFIPGVD